MNFPAILDVEYMLFWAAGIADYLALVARFQDSNQLAIPGPLITPVLVLSFILNQSSKQHPDHDNSIRLPALAIGLSQPAFHIANLIAHRIHNRRASSDRQMGWILS